MPERTPYMNPGAPVHGPRKGFPAAANQHRRIYAIAALLLWILLPAATLRAYVPHPLHMLDLMLGKPKKIHSVVMDQRMTIHALDPQTPPDIFKCKVYFQWPKGYRMEQVGETGHRIQVVNGDDNVVIRDGFIEPEPAGLVDLYHDPLYFRTRSDMARRLSQQGIDINIAGPGLWQDRPQWVLGARYPDTAKSQLWINKESFRPLGWLINPTGTRGYPVWEIRYLNWQNRQGFRYPGQITFYQDEVLIREIEIMGVRVNVKLTPDLFDLHKLRVRYPVRTQEQSPGQPVNEVEQALEDFSKMYRN